MAKILICHVPKDGSLARELGGALMGHGHAISFDGEPDAPRADRSIRLRYFEAVIVIWTETSCQSAGLAAIAREMMPLNLLVPVRADDLPVARLPLMFRKLHMFAPRDADGISRLIARLTTAATSLKEMAERAARIGIELRRESPAPIRVSKKRGMTSETKSPFTGSEPSSGERALHRSAVPEAIIPAQYAQYTPRTSLYLDLPEVDEADVEPPLSLEREQQEPKPETPIPGKSPIRASVQSSIATMDSDERTLSAQLERSAQHTLAAALSMPVQLAEQPTPYSAIGDAQTLSDAIEAGLLLHYIPDKMWLGEPGAIEVRLVPEVLNRFFRSGIGKGTTVETLSISLYGAGGAFEIERLSERTQAVTAQADAVASWTWHATPLVAGTQDLVVRVSALLSDRNGVPAPIALPDRRFRVDIAVPEGSRIMPSLSSG